MVGHVGPSKLLLPGAEWLVSAELLVLTHMAWVSEPRSGMGTVRAAGARKAHGSRVLQEWKVGTAAHRGDAAASASDAHSRKKSRKKLF
jgi:hypothetical protein